MTVLSPAEYWLLIFLDVVFVGLIVWLALRLRRQTDRSDYLKALAHACIMHLGFITQCPDAAIPPYREVLRRWLKDNGFEIELTQLSGPAQDDDRDDGSSSDVTLRVM